MHSAYSNYVVLKKTTAPDVVCPAGLMSLVFDGESAPADFVSDAPDITLHTLSGESLSPGVSPARMAPFN